MRAVSPAARPAVAPYHRKLSRAHSTCAQSGALNVCRSMDPMAQTPVALGYRMPAEWEPHAATWLSWPRREGISFPDSFNRVLPALRAMVEALIESEQVCINVCNGAHEAEARAALRGLS